MQNHRRERAPRPTDSNDKRTDKSEFDHRRNDTERVWAVTIAIAPSTQRGRRLAAKSEFDCCGNDTERYPGGVTITARLGHAVAVSHADKSEFSEGSFFSKIPAKVCEVAEDGKAVYGVRPGLGQAHSFGMPLNSQNRKRFMFEGLHCAVLRA